jgi:hypothetical protein
MSRYLFSLVLVFAAAVFVSGCSVVRIDSEETTPDFHSPRRSAQDVLFLEKINKPGDIIGRVFVSVYNGRPIAEVIAKMRDEAAILGGDAITGIRSQPESVMRTRYMADVILFK